MSFFGGFTKGFADGYNADIAAKKAAALEKEKYKLNLEYKTNYEANVNDKLNTVNFGSFPVYDNSGEFLSMVNGSIVKDYNAKDSEYDYNNIQKINNFLKKEIQYGDTVISIGDYALNQYKNNDKDRASEYDPFISNVLNTARGHMLAYENANRPKGAGSENKQFNVMQALGDVHPMLKLVYNSNYVDELRSSGVDAKLINGQPVVEPETVVNNSVTVYKKNKENGQEEPVLVKVNSDKYVKQAAKNAGISVEDYLLTTYPNASTSSELLSQDSSKKKRFDAGMVLVETVPGLYNGLVKGDLTLVDARQFSQVASNFLDPDGRSFIGDPNESGSYPIIQIQEGVAVYSTADLKNKHSLDSFISDKRGANIENSIKSMGYEKIGGPQTALDSVNKVTNRINQMEVLVENRTKSGTGQAPTGKLLIGIEILGRGLGALPGQITNIIGSSENQNVEDNGGIIKSVLEYVGRYKGEDDDYSSAQAFKRFNNSAQEGRRSYKKLVDETVGANKLFKNQQELDLAYKNYRMSKGEFNEKQINVLKRLDNSYAAVMNYHSYLLAFEMAAAAQGGGDSRTISDRDVKIMQNVIFSKFMATDDFKAVLGEIKDSMSILRDTHALYANAVRKNKQSYIDIANLMTSQGGPVSVPGSGSYSDRNKIGRGYLRTSDKLKQNTVQRNIEDYDIDFNQTESDGVEDISNMDFGDSTLGSVAKTMEGRGRSNNNTLLANDLKGLVDDYTKYSDPPPIESYTNLFAQEKIKQQVREALEAVNGRE